MRRVTDSWISALGRPSERVSADAVLHGTFPIVPWITPRVHDDLLRLIANLGTERTLEAGERLFGDDECISRVVVVKSGLMGRAIGAPYAQSKCAIAIAPPGHFAAGNLNFFSHRPAIGRYVALTKCTVTGCSQETLGRVAAGDPALMALLALQLEVTSLSDRLGFAVLSLLDAEDRLRVLLIVWALNFGELTENGGWIRMPYACGYHVRSRVANTSEYWTAKCMKQWKEKGVWRSEGELEFVRTDFLENTFSWLMAAGEKADRYTPPATLRELMV